MVSRKNRVKRVPFLPLTITRRWVYNPAINQYRRKQMKNELDITTVEPKTSRKNTEMVKWMFDQSNNIRPAKTVFISKNFTVAQVENALNLRDTIQAMTGVSLDEIDILQKSTSELQSIYNAKCAARNKRAGVRALVSKYGHESAERIVKNHSGRTIK
jgi:hypothetical protein